MIGRGVDRGREVEGEVIELMVGKGRTCSIRSAAAAISLSGVDNGREERTV